jgi:hypothetical protein
MHWQTMLTRVDEEVLKQKNCKDFHAHKKTDEHGSSNGIHQEF